MTTLFIRVQTILLLGTVILLSFLFVGCNSSVNYENLTPFTGANNVRMVVEIPAGTNAKIEYDEDTQTFQQDTENGLPRVINFLPYPGNYGFIPGTKMAATQGRNGDALDVLLIAAHLPTGTVVEIQPIAILFLEDNGEADHKIIAIPADESIRTITATNFMDFLVEQDAAKKIIEDWFLNYKGWGKMRMIGWESEEVALEEIRKYRVSEE